MMKRTEPSGRRQVRWILAIVPTGKMSSIPGSSTSTCRWVKMPMGDPASAALSRAFRDRSRPAVSWLGMWG